MSLLVREIGGREWKEVFGPVPNTSQMRENDRDTHSLIHVEDPQSSLAAELTFSSCWCDAH